MLAQQSPFKGEDEDEIYDAILAGDVSYPTAMSEDSVTILKALLLIEPASRLGSGPTGAEEIKNHPFFKGINWTDVYEKKLTPPFIPNISESTNVGNFDSEFTTQSPTLTPVQSGMLLFGGADARKDSSYVGLC